MMKVLNSATYMPQYLLNINSMEIEACFTVGCSLIVGLCVVLHCNFVFPAKCYKYEQSLSGALIVDKGKHISIVVKKSLLKAGVIVRFRLLSHNHVFVNPYQWWLPICYRLGCVDNEFKCQVLPY